MITSSSKKAVAIGVMFALGAVGASAALAQSWKINKGINIGVMAPSESRKLADGSTYLSGGARYVVEPKERGRTTARH